MKKPEILAPAGDLEKLETAVVFGADAVYLGGKELSLRAAAGNFSIEDIEKGVSFAHTRGKKVYITLNIFPHNKDIDIVNEYARKLALLNVDALIVSDPGLIRIIQEILPNMPLHLSTQANVTNWSSALFWKQQGIKRINVARELSLQEIKEISNNSDDIEVESFVHGAICISYSGRCLLSNFLTGRGSNQGICSHPCRYKYYLVEEKRPGEFMPAVEDERGAYIFNSRDLCMLPYLQDLTAAGIQSFKIEGRMKSVHYVATVVKAYREVLDNLIIDGGDKNFTNKWLEEIKKVSHRGYTTGFYFRKPDSEDYSYESSAYIRNYDFVGVVKEFLLEKNICRIEQRNYFKRNETLEFLTPKGELFTFKIDNMMDQDGNLISAAPHPQQMVLIKTDRYIEPYTVVRRKVN